MPSKHVCSLRAVSCFILPILTILWALGGSVLSAQVSVSTVSCPFAGGGNTSVFNGFYVADYPGNNLSQVTLGYTANFAEQFGITLTAHRNSYDGPILGTPQTATVDVPTSGEMLVTFDFGGAPVSPGDTIAFTQTYAIYGPVGAVLSYDGNIGTCNGVFRTAGTAPPLGTAVTGSVGVAITQVNRSGQSCIPSDTVLCLDDTPGDHRFQVTASYQTAQAGGLFGYAQAIPLAPLGVTQGGLFWFFNQKNPEILVKILNGCAINDHYWAYISAGTNVGFTVKVLDTATASFTKTYTNTDLTMALPIQDTSALATCHSCSIDAQCRPGLLCCPNPFDYGRTCAPPTVNGGCALIP